MIDSIVSVYRCPNCGYKVLSSEQVDNGSLECDNCGVEMASAGHMDIAISEN